MSLYSAITVNMGRFHLEKTFIDLGTITQIYLEILIEFQSISSTTHSYTPSSLENLKHYFRDTADFSKLTLT